MSTFIGHAFPGVVYLVLATWWTINIFKRFFASKGRDGIPYRSQPWYPGPFGATFPSESALKIIAGFIGITAEVVAYLQNDSSDRINIYMTHITMYFFVLLNAAMDLMKSKGFPLPDGVEAATGVLWLGVHGFLLSSHLHDGRPMLDVVVHRYLVYAYSAAVLSVLLEMCYCDAVVTSLARAFFVLLLGTWLCQLGLIIYAPFPGMRKWDMDNHEQAMLATLIFTWHMVVNLVLMMLVGAAVWFCVRRGQRLNHVGYHLIKPELPVMSVSGKKSSEPTECA